MKENTARFLDVVLNLSKDIRIANRAAMEIPAEEASTDRVRDDLRRGGLGRVPPHLAADSSLRLAPLPGLQKCPAFGGVFEDERVPILDVIQNSHRFPIIFSAARNRSPGSMI